MSSVLRLRQLPPHTDPRQSPTHRHVSVRLRAVALTWRVTLRPKKLKRLIEHMIASPLQSTAGVPTIWFQHVEEARVRTVRVPGRDHEEHEWEQQRDGRRAERALEPDRDERRNLVPA
jgi:hypothetical protein